MVAPTEIAEAIIAALITAMGLAALALGAARWKSGDRSAAWFAVFAGLYGLRLARQSQLFPPAFPEIVWRYGPDAELQDDVTMVVVDIRQPVP